MSVIDKLKVLARVKAHPLVSLAKVGEVTDVVRIEVVPGEMYPKTIQAILNSIASNTDWPLLMIKNMVLKLPVNAWYLALKEKETLSQDEQKLRAEALEVARLWFTERLHQTISHKPMTLLILKDDRWRL